MFEFTGNDIAALINFSTLSFIASVVVGSTSLADGVMLQITYGIVQSVLPYATTDSSIGEDGFRAVTVFMFIRLVIVTPFLMVYLWYTTKEKEKKKGKPSDADTAAIPAAPATATATATDPANKGAVTTTTQEVGTPTTAVVVPPPVARPQPTFSLSLYICFVAPNVIWAFVGMLVLKKSNSAQIRPVVGAVCISFSALYVALRAWKASSIKDTMPQWVKTLFSPKFLVEGTTDTMTWHAKVACCVTFSLSGLMLAVSGMGAPPIMIVVLLYDIPMHISRHTLPAASTTASLVRTSLAVYNGLITLDLWPFYVPAVFAGLLGIVVGVRIGNVLTPAMYSASIVSLLVLAGTVLLTSSPYVTVPLPILLVVGLVAKHRHDKKKSSAAFVAVSPSPPIALSAPQHHDDDGEEEEMGGDASLARNRATLAMAEHALGGGGDGAAAAEAEEEDLARACGKDVDDLPN